MSQGLHNDLDCLNPGFLSGEDVLPLPSDVLHHLHTSLSDFKDVKPEFSYLLSGSFLHSSQTMRQVF